MRRLLSVGFGDIARRMVVRLTVRLIAALAKGGSLPRHLV